MFVASLRAQKMFAAQLKALEMFVAQQIAQKMCAAQLRSLNMFAVQLRSLKMFAVQLRAWIATFRARSASSVVGCRISRGHLPTSSSLWGKIALKNRTQPLAQGKKGSSISSEWTSVSAIQKVDKHKLHKNWVQVDFLSHIWFPLAIIDDFPPRIESWYDLTHKWFIWLLPRSCDLIFLRFPWTYPCRQSMSH